MYGKIREAEATVEKLRNISDRRIAKKMVLVTIPADGCNRDGKKEVGWGF
jgi:hypothetical protein